MTDPVLAHLTAALADRYRIGRELGRGGMATVYLAHDLKHDRPVALKVLHPERAAALGPDRFRREIMLAARLQHPHILSVYDSGDSAGQLWFTMPFVDGESLRDRLNREKQLPVEDAVRIVREAALALEYAHHHGVIHRDIKPENLLLTTDGSMLVADFGIARAVGGDQQLTGTGVAIGTPAYMSPEQASGARDLDARSDVYALGCVLFEMLAGEPPYTGPTPQAIMARALTETPRPIHPMRPAVSEVLDAVIAKATAATVADRYAGAAELARALEQALRVASVVTPSPGRVSRQRQLLTRIAYGLLLGVVVVSVWRWFNGRGNAPGATLMAVLPFENLGAAEDEYIADGIADEVRGRLSMVPGIQVIARGSSMPYKRSEKPQQQIVRELGVRYLLTATVRWETSTGGARKVHVSPELVQVVGSGVPSTRWHQSFDVDASLTDVFQMYGDIASRVAQALGVALGDSSRQQLSEKATQNSAAYDAFLRGEEASEGMLADYANMRRAVTYYAQAIALDSTFVEAWAQRSRAHSSIYFFSTPTPAEGNLAREAAERALALAPGSAEGHLAMGDFFRQVLRDYPRSIEQYAQGQRLAPNNVSVLTALAMGESGLGQWEVAGQHLRQAATVDPRSVEIANWLSITLLMLRRYSEAVEAVDRGLAVAPDNLVLLEDKAMIALARGDLAGARAVIATAPKEVDPAALVAFFGNYSDLYWLLDDAKQQLLLQLAPSAFDGERAVWSHVLAQTYWLRGDTVRARLYADSARIAFQEQLRASPEDAQRHVFLGIALAFLGRNAEAVEHGRRAIALAPIAQDAIQGPYLQHQLVRIYMLTGELEKALDHLEPLLKTPYYLSPGWLKVDPSFDPLRNHPRFRRLVAGGS